MISFSKISELTQSFLRNRVYRQVLSAKVTESKANRSGSTRFYQRTETNFTYVSSAACLATVLSFVQSPLNQSSRGAVAASPGLPAPRWRLPGLPRWVTWLWN